MIRTRNPGAALVEEARTRGSEIVYFDMAHAPANERVFGPITTQLLRDRPCRIVIETVPPGGPKPVPVASGDGHLKRLGVKHKLPGIRI